jgi:hypothetical protein
MAEVDLTIPEGVLKTATGNLTTANQNLRKQVNDKVDNFLGTISNWTGDAAVAFKNMTGTAQGAGGWRDLCIKGIDGLLPICEAVDAAYSRDQQAEAELSDQVNAFARALG